MIKVLKPKFHSAFVLNLEHSDFDIVLANLIKWVDLDMRILYHRSPFFKNMLNCQNQSQNFRDNALGLWHIY
jgi:hypothetical protein